MKKILCFNNLIGLLLLWFIANLQACKHCEKLEKNAVAEIWGDISPTCGPLSGTIVYMKIGLYTYLGKDKIEICDESVTSVTVDGVAATVISFDYGGNLLVKLPPHAAGTATITVKFKLSCPGCTAIEKTVTTSFEYIDLPAPTVTDPYPDISHINLGGDAPEDWQGNCGGGYKRTINGYDFRGNEDNKPKVRFDNMGETRWLLPEEIDIVWTDDKKTTIRELSVTVPPGDAGTWADVFVYNPECDTAFICNDDVAFYYDQTPCIETEALDLEVTDCGTGPTYVETGNFINDVSGYIDVVTASYGSGKQGRVRIYENDGTGELSLYTYWDVYGRPSALAVGNFDNNLFPDIVVTLKDANQVAVLLNNGTDFTSVEYYSTETSPIGIVAPDLDNDGELDLAILNESSISLTLYKGDGTGAFSSGFGSAISLSGSGPVAIDKGNFDGTGGEDIVVAFSGKSIELYTSTGSTTPIGLKTTAVLSASFTPVDLKAGNFFTDGSPGVAVLSSGSGYHIITLVKYNNTSGNFESAMTNIELAVTTDTPVVLATGDYDNGTTGDFAVGYKNGSIEVVRMSGETVLGKENFVLSELAITDLVSDFLRIEDAATIGEDLVVAFEEAYLVVVKNKGAEFD